jgi:hypothetical protein
MQRKAIWVPLAAMILLAGCGPLESLRPLYTEEDLISDSRFQGVWEVVPNEGDACLLTLSPNAQSASHLRCTTKDGHKDGFEVYLVQLGGFQFFDFSAEDSNDFQIPVHWFAKVLSITDSELRIAFIGTNWLEDRIEEASFPSYVRAGKSESDMVLTGSTRDLQHFVLTHAVEPQAFDEDATALRRVQ